MFSARSTSNWQMRTLNKSTLYFKAKFSASSHGRISKILIKTTTRNLTVTFSLNGALLSSYVIIKKNKIKKKRTGGKRLLGSTAAKNTAALLSGSSFSPSSFFQWLSLAVIGMVGPVLGLLPRSVAGELASLGAVPCPPGM